MMPIIMLAAAALAEPTATPPMTPTSKWNVDYGATACMLGRVYGAGKDETVMAFRMTPLGSSLDLLISTKDRNAAFRLGKAQIALDGAETDDSDYESFPTQTPGMRMTRMPVEAALFKTLPTSAVLRVAPEKMRGWAFAMPSAKAAFAALARCNDATVAKWGLDPTERLRIAVPAEAVDTKTNWVTVNDYPKSVVAKGAQGSTLVLWTIGIDGRIRDCRTLVSSEEAELDEAACRAITRRGRYTPALDADGKPMVSHSTRKVTWRLPGMWNAGR